MRFSTIFLLPVLAVMAAPSPDTSADERAANIAALKDLLSKIPTTPVPQAVQARDPQAAQPTSTPTGGQGLGSALTDLESLFSGLSSTLTGVCNLRSDLTNLMGQLGL